MNEEETPEVYRKHVNDYFDSVENQIAPILSHYINYDYDNNMDYLNFLVYPESFVYSFSVSPVMIFNEIEADPSLEDLFLNVSPSLRDDLNPYDVDLDHREDIFMELLQNRFSEMWNRIVGDEKDQYPTKFYLQVPDYDPSWCINSSSYVENVNK